MGFLRGKSNKALQRDELISQLDKAEITKKPEFIKKLIKNHKKDKYIVYPVTNACFEYADEVMKDKTYSSEKLNSFNPPPVIKTLDLFYEVMEEGARKIRKFDKDRIEDIRNKWIELTKHGLKQYPVATLQKADEIRAKPYNDNTSWLSSSIYVDAISFIESYEGKDEKVQNIIKNKDLMLPNLQEKKENTNKNDPNNPDDDGIDCFIIGAIAGGAG